MDEDPLEGQCGRPLKPLGIQLMLIRLGLGPFQASWALLGAARDSCGTSWDTIGSNLRHLGRNWIPMGVQWESNWEQLGSSWTNQISIDFLVVLEYFE